MLLANRSGLVVMGDILAGNREGGALGAVWFRPNRPQRYFFRMQALSGRDSQGSSFTECTLE